MSFERKVTAINSDTHALTFDAPILLGVDADYGSATVTKATERRISHVGVEQIRFDSVFDKSVTRAYPKCAQTWIGPRRSTHTLRSVHRCSADAFHRSHCLMSRWPVG